MKINIFQQKVCSKDNFFLFLSVEGEFSKLLRLFFKPQKFYRFCLHLLISYDFFLNNTDHLVNEVETL